MRRCVMLCLTLTMMSACNGDRVAEPTLSRTSPTNDISDATHTGVGLASNPDFFFLPPMVKDPSASLLWNAGAFNGSLAPTVSICELQAADEASITSATPCLYAVNYAAVVSLADEHYKVNWPVPVSSTIFYRATIKVGAIRLGFADLATGGTQAQVKSLASGEVIALLDGRTLPIKFRIERYALCETPGAPTCTSASADISTAALTLSTGTPTSDPSGISTAAGVSIPVQGGTNSIPVTATLSSCSGISQAIGRRTVGECVRVTTEPRLTNLANRATVFICAVGVGAYGLTEAEASSVTMYRYDDQGVAALAHTDACKPNQPGGIVAFAGPSFGGMLASIRHGQLKRAASQAIALLSPKPLYASMYIDLGGGGLTESFSDFQFALPPSVLIYGPTLFTPPTGDSRKNEKILAEAAGMTVTVWDAGTWASKTTADFAKFSAIIFGDPNCLYSTTHLNTAYNNRATWSPVVQGPAVIVGTDPVFHQGAHTQALTLMTNAIKFAASNPNATGLYANLSCYYDFTSTTDPTLVDFLSGIGEFRVRGRYGLGEIATVVNPSHAVMAGVTSDGLSNWGFSVHEAFPALATYPASFQALATINVVSSTETVPYIIARGSVSP